MSKISELTTMTRSDLAMTGDYLPILDASAETVKKISVNTLLYPSGDIINHDITSLITSDYTVISGYIRPICGRLAVYEVTIANGTDGIPISIQGTVSSENLYTLPSIYVLGSIAMELNVVAMSEVPPTPSYQYNTLVRVYSDVINNTIAYHRNVPTLSASNMMIPSNCLNGSGNIKGLRFKGFILLKEDIVLP